MALTLCVIRQKTFPALTAEQEATVKRYLRADIDPGTVVQHYADITVRVMDIQTLGPGKWLNDAIINFYRALIQVRCDNQKLKVWLFNTHFYDKLGLPFHYNEVKRWTKRCKPSIFDKDLLIVPFNILESHWCCGVINFPKKRFEVYDSSHWIDENIFRKKMVRYLQEAQKDILKSKFEEEEWSTFKCDCPKQDNGFDCGVFTLHFMRCLALNKRVGDRAEFDFGQRDMPYLRKQMILDTLNKEILGEAAKP